MKLLERINEVLSEDLSPPPAVGTGLQKKGGKFQLNFPVKAFKVEQNHLVGNLTDLHLDKAPQSFTVNFGSHQVEFTLADNDGIANYSSDVGLTATLANAPDDGWGAGL